MSFQGLDDVELALQSQQRCLAAAQDDTLPLLDRLSIRIAFNYLQLFSGAGRRAPGLLSARPSCATRRAGSSGSFWLGHWWPGTGLGHHSRAPLRITWPDMPFAFHAGEVSWLPPNHPVLCRAQQTWVTTWASEY